MGRILRLPHIESYLKTAHQIRGSSPSFIRAHIQLAGDDLANNHIFKLLSGLHEQTLYKNITLGVLFVNAENISELSLLRHAYRLPPKNYR